MENEIPVEQWKNIKGYEGKYEISNWGRVKSLKWNTFNGYIWRPKILKRQLNIDGYPVIILHCKNKKDKMCRIPRLVAEAFIPNPNNYPIINHKDENRLNSHVDNLEWCTYSYNVHYGSCLKKMSEVKKGKKFTEEHINNIRKAAEKRKGVPITGIPLENMRKAGLKRRGEKHSRESVEKMASKQRGIPRYYARKKVYQYDMNWNFIQEFNGVCDASRFLFDGDPKKGRHISEICLNKKKTLYGYHWTYNKIDDEKSDH